jgi:hypothetical protein
MRIGLSLLLLAVWAAGVVGNYATCPGCLPRDRFNKTCEWAGDTQFPLDEQNPAHRAHLVEDAQLAEELAIRHADAEFDRRFGVEHHGGLIDNGRFRNDCLSGMFAAIEANHGVTSGQVALARGQRNHAFDLVVVLLFIPLYAIGAAMACRRLGRRFSGHERYVRLVATGVTSVVVTLFGLVSLRLWAAVWEVVRVGNGHMTGMRAASDTRWTGQYPGVDFLAAMLVFWLMAVLSRRAAADAEPEEEYVSLLN